MTNTRLYQVTAPHLCAGIVMLGELCCDSHRGCASVEAAPILAWCVDKQRKYLRAYFKRRGWSVVEAKERV